MTDNYKYSKLELTPTIFKELLIQFFDGKQFDRQTAIETILSYHKDNSGLIKEGKSIISVFKKATQILQGSGIENLGYGIWKLNYKIRDTEIVESKKQIEETVFVDKCIGCGNNSVYVYYYDSYKELAELKGESIWQCKIGRTDVNPLQRIVSQVGTCYPELPHIALVINCNDSAALESALHSILKYKHRHISNAPGKEWYSTSPSEIEEIYLSLQ